MPRRERDKLRPRGAPSAARWWGGLSRRVGIAEGAPSTRGDGLRASAYIYIYSTRCVSLSREHSFSRVPRRCWTGLMLSCLLFLLLDLCTRAHFPMPYVITLIFDYYYYYYLYESIGQKLTIACTLGQCLTDLAIIVDHGLFLLRNESAIDLESLFSHLSI